MSYGLGSISEAMNRNNPGSTRDGAVPLAYHFKLTLLSDQPGNCTEYNIQCFEAVIEVQYGKVPNSSMIIIKLNANCASKLFLNTGVWLCGRLLQVENFFCMGSPLAVFLALRGIRPGSSVQQDHILPTSICRRLFNVFHPTDPVVSGSPPPIPHIPTTH